ncbi:hypothetical protein ACP70R_047291 [Stipagrostis hirtigluma subsp. patula]
MGIGRKRRRGGGELARAAEVVMVLAAAGEARGGRAPTAAERALAAEARGALVAAVGEVARPRELFRTEAVRALVQDLGLSRARGPAAMGYRPRRASIAERVLLTRRKMQEMKEALIPSTANAPKTIASGAKTQFQHEASKYTTGLPRNLSTPMTSQVISKQPLLNGTAAVASSVKPPNVPSMVSPQSFGVADIKVEKDVSGSNFAHGARTVDQSDRSYHHTASSSNQNSTQSYSQAEKSLDEKAPSINPVIGSIVMGYQAPSREVSVQKQSIFSNHNAIAKDIEQILHQPVNHPSWTVPSTEYINTRLDCQICKVLVADVESLLVCDACERGMHLKCLQRYGNQGLPKTEWYCPACVARTKGKSLPPKYGKVTRTIVAPKTSMTSGVTQSSSQVTAESPSTKDSSKKVSANGSVINQFSNEVGSTVREDVMLSLDMTSSKSLSISGAGPEKENTKHDEISSIQKEGTGQPCVDMLTETENSCCEVQSTGTSMYGPANLSGGSHMPTESSDVNSVKGSALQSLSVLNHSDHSFVVSSIEGCKSTGTSHQHPSKKVQMTSTRTLTNEIHQADGVTANGMGTSHKHEKMALDAISDHGNVHQVTLNGNICPGHEIEGDLKDGYVGCSTASSVHWVGDGLKSVDDKTYYNSCSIDGIIYNLHDHILISSEGGTSCPCKLQSLWEEHDSGCRLAMVNPYLFVSNIPESISKPCIDEENEVYGSNNQRIVLVSAIYGPCEVLHIDKFREETKRRCQLDSSGSRLHPIFFCRWTYDESDSSFYKDYNVES